MSKFLTGLLQEQNAGSPPKKMRKSTNKKTGSPPDKKKEVHQIKKSSPPSATGGRTPLAVVDTKQPTAENADLKKSTETSKVDLKQSTAEISGSPPKTATDYRKGDRHSKDLVRQQFRIPQSHDQRFREFRAKNRLNITEFYELAALHFIACGGSPQNSEVDLKASPDDRRLLMFKTKLSIINLHLRFNPHLKWKPTDDEAAAKYNDVDERILEIAFMQTQFNARFKKIHSFKYYVEQIETTLADVATSGIADLDAYHKMVQTAWERSKPD